MILVDASVLIDYLRTKNTKLAGLFQTLPVAISGVTRAEVLCGARNPADEQRLLAFLQAFQQVPTPEPIWDRVGENLATMNAKGIAIPNSRRPRRDARNRKRH